MASQNSWEMASQTVMATFDQVEDATARLLMDKVGLTGKAPVKAVSIMRPGAFVKALDKAMEISDRTPVQPDWLIVTTAGFVWIAACEYCRISKGKRPDHGVPIPNIQPTKFGVAPSPEHAMRIQKALEKQIADIRAILGAEGQKINVAANKEGSSTQACLAPPRLVSTTHKADGTSFFASDDVIQPFQPFGPSMAAFYNFDIRKTLPANNAEAVSPSTFANKFPQCAPGGAYFGVVDIPPNQMAPMHRTMSLDWAAVLSGEIVCVLDGGQEKTIGQGEFIIQRGTNHQWVNRSQTEVARILCVMVGAEKVALEDGKELEEAVPKE